MQFNKRQLDRADTSQSTKKHTQKKKLCVVIPQQDN